jgi:lysophospholipase L1-like esterase
MLTSAQRHIILGSRWPRGYLNLGSRYLPTWSAKLAQVKAGTGRARILCIGDSTTRGTGAGSGDALNVDADQFAYPKKLADYLASRGVSASFNSAMSGSFGNGTPEGKDSRVAGLNHMTPAGDWIGGASTLGGLTYQCNDDLTGTLSFTPLNVFDTLRIGYLRQTTNDTFTVNIDGGAAIITQAAAGTGSFQVTADTTVARGLHTININRTETTAGVCRIIWFEVWDSTTPAVEVFNAGWSGGTAADMAVNATLVQPIAGLQKFAPDLTIIMLGINDQTGATSEATFKTSVQTIVTAARLSGDAILVAATPASTTGGEPARRAYANYMRDMAIINGCPFVDTNTLMGTYAHSTNMGWQGNGLHASAAGYAYLAPLIGRALAGV